MNDPTPTNVMEQLEEFDDDDMDVIDEEDDTSLDDDKNDRDVEDEDADDDVSIDGEDEDDVQGSDEGDGDDDGPVTLEALEKELELEDGALSQIMATVKVGDEDRQVALSDALQAYSKGTDLDAREKELESERFTLEDTTQTLQQSSEAQEAGVKAHHEALQGILDSIYKDALEDLMETDPKAYHANARKLDGIKEQVQQKVQEASGNFETQRRQEMDLVYDAHVKHLRRSGLSEEDVQAAAETLGKEFNISWKGAVIAGPAPLMKMAHELKQLRKTKDEYDKLTKKISQVKSRSQGKTTSQGARSGRSKSKGSGSRLVDRLRKTGDPDAAVGVLDQLGLGEHSPGRTTLLEG